MQAVKTTRITFRANAVLRGKLAEAAGDYGSLSNVVRVILERHFDGRMILARQLHKKGVR